jgi:hypothetical protein
VPSLHRAHDHRRIGGPALGQKLRQFEFAPLSSARYAAMKPATIRGEASSDSEPPTTGIRPSAITTPNSTANAADSSRGFLRYWRKPATTHCKPWLAATLRGMS